MGDKDSQSLFLIKYYIRIKIHIFIILNFWIESGVVKDLCFDNIVKRLTLNLI